MDTHTSLAASRIQGFLAEEPIVWLSTVRPNGAPHVVPIWFWWDGEAVLVFSKPDAQKVRNLRERPAVMLALGEAENDFDIGMIEGEATLLDVPTGAVLPAAHLDKYRDQMAAIGLDPDTYATTYSQAIRIVPNRYLGWHGRTLPRSTRIAGAPLHSMVEPIRPELVQAQGEPISKRTPAPAALRPAVTDHVRRPLLERLLGEPLARGLTAFWFGPARTAAAASV